MFSYYGTKKKLGKLYPPPKYKTIIEPFAGAAGYSLLYPDNQVILYDTNPKICAVWDFLIHANKKDILSLPDVQTGQKVTDFGLSDPEKWLIGFCINPGSTTPKITASKRAKWASYKTDIANRVDKIKHWVIIRGSYSSIPNKEATWFVDPPYQKAGKYYFGYSQMDFQNLGLWIRQRFGQVIACENAGADYLPFTFLAEHRGSMQKNTEVIWLNETDTKGIFDD